MLSLSESLARTLPLLTTVEPVAKGLYGVSTPVLNGPAMRASFSAAVKASSGQYPHHTETTHFLALCEERVEALAARC